MSISVAEVLAAVQANMPQAASETTSTIVRPLRAALKALSAATNALYTIDSDTSLASGTKSISYPSDFKALDKIVLTDSNGNDGAPLIEKNWDWYLKRKEDESAGETDEPTYFIEKNRKFYLHEKSDGVYTVNIYFWRYHPEDVASILFPDEWREAIYDLTTWFLARQKGRSRYMQLYGGQYQQQAVGAALGFVQVPESAGRIAYHDV